mmetsp:Transcript_10165/g.24870  ORF Transcript_10165/g.24870 Transcript_10165/m.24870 type:complete len:446 (+) Transcript_10165:184-1521(+)|eukprot:CAMPEP_0180137656 /NCGR_PEP_ID=MMETSP0986-20121125/12365_1 /TAXON_ID=697907 /ORGANISM="non described non described, Strain CCMP2293" /LENGTH=445 /DNA_ID=CAMNT_0022079205 /DNA_START=324 /DNA_END=1661 /DNA_ORIENTATION=+
MAATGTSSAAKERFKYQTGFGNTFESEALPGALPKGRNNPQRCPLGLYAEQLSGTAFTAPREQNQRSWLYRIAPSVDAGAFIPAANPPPNLLADFSSIPGNPNQLRWNPLPLSTDSTQDWADGLVTVCGSGSAEARKGVAIHMYSCSVSMTRAMVNSDGDMLIVPQQRTLTLQTEFGFLEIPPGEVCVVPRGIVFRVLLDTQKQEGAARGYVLETFNGHFSLPSLGAIGANGLANARDFQYPVAAFEDIEEEVTLLNKFCGRLWSRELGRSPFDVVAWHGNYAPYKYDLANFNTMGTVSFDHPDPSIFTVLSCASDTPGEAAVDFAIFPPRWMVAENTFRPPYFHRNLMSEFMGMIHGKYDAKQGFSPGGASLHPCMTAHGPDAATVAAASNAVLSPHKFEGGLAFMFETSAMLKATPAALEAPWRDSEYGACWKGIPRTFVPVG